MNDDGALSRRLSQWVDLAVETGHRPGDAFPTVAVLDLLSETFEATATWCRWTAPDHPAVPRSVTRVRRELWIPLARSLSGPSCFLLTREGPDFTDTHLALAGQLQPLLMLLERQAGRAARRAADLSARFGLTAREATVLALLDQNLTMTAIAARLGCSPRTVEKHAEHLYRKLGVRDRLSAVRLDDVRTASRP